MKRLDHIETQMQKRFDDLMRLQRDTGSRLQKATEDQPTPVAPVRQSNGCNGPGGGAQRLQGGSTGVDPSTRSTPPSFRSHSEPNNPRSVVLCWQCGKPGHIRRYCPQNEAKSPGANTQIHATSATRGSGQKTRLNTLDQDDVYLKLYL